MKFQFLSLLCIPALLMLSGCNQTPKTQAAQEDSSAPQAEPADESDQYFKLDGDFAGSHILIAYSGAQRAKTERSKEEALEKGNQLLARITQEPELFEEIAKMESDGPSGPVGGSLGSWKKGRMVAEFDTAIAQLKEGEIAPGLVETGFGYHIIRRDSMNAKHFASDGFCISYSGAVNTPQDVSRTKEEAQKLAEQVAAKLSRENFDALAKEYNDFTDQAMFLGVTRHGDKMNPSLWETLDTLAYGEVAGPLELPLGFAFVRRRVVEKRAGAHILIAFKGADRARPEVSRTKEEALAEAQAVIHQLQDDLDQFSELAKTKSDGPSGPRGGNLGSWFRGFMDSSFEKAVDNLKEGEVTQEPVETIYGFHVIRRDPLEVAP